MTRKDHTARAFLETVLDGLPEHIAVLDTAGTIQYVNEPWRQFSEANAGPAALDWTTVNYLAVCETAAADGDPYAQQADEAIKALAAGTSREQTLQYPCHSPTQYR